MAGLLARGGAAAGDADWRVTWPLVTNGVLDVISKVFFGKIIVEAYSPLFDPLQQQVKVLNEVVSHIASSMGVIWSSSKDALLVETRYGDGDEAGFRPDLHRNRTFYSGKHEFGAKSSVSRKPEPTF